jgi:hypothetical protein
LFETYREIIPTLVRQTKEPTYFVRRQLPPTAKTGANDPGFAHARPAEPLES